MSTRRWWWGALAGVGWLVCAVTGPATAADPDQPALTLEAVLEQAVQHQPKLAQVQSDLDIAKARLRQAWSTVLPQVSVAGSHTYAQIGGGSSSSTSTSSSSSEGHTTTGSVAVTQTLWDFGRSVARIRQGRAEQAAARWQGLTTRQAVLLTATDAYLTAFEAQEYVAVALHAVEQAAQQLKRAQGFAAVGLQRRTDVLTAQAAFSQAQLAHLQATDTAVVAKRTLNEAMGGRDDINYRLVEPSVLASTSVDELPLEEALTRALAQRAELKYAATTMEALDAERQAIGRDWLPTLEASGEYEARKRESIDRTDTWSATLNATWDVWDGGLTAAQTAEAAASTRRARADVELATLTVTREVHESWLRARELSRQVTVAEQFVAEAAERLRLVEGQYAAGITTALDVTNALQVVTAARQVWLAARTEAYMVRVELRHAMGEAL